MLGLSGHQQANAMTRDCTVNVVQLLQATLSILANEEYRAKDSEPLADLRKCLEGAISEIEASKGQVPVG